MSAEASLVLKTVAQSFLDQNRPLQAIRCLEALCLTPCSDFPEQEAGLHCEVRKITETQKTSADAMRKESRMCQAGLGKLSSLLCQ